MRYCRAIWSWSAESSREKWRKNVREPELRIKSLCSSGGEQRVTISVPRHVAPDYFEWLDVQVALETSTVQSTDVPASVAALAGLALASPAQAVAKTIPEPVPVEQTVAAASVGVVSSPSVSVGSAAVESGTDSQPAKKPKRTSGKGYYCAVPLCSNRSLDYVTCISSFSQ